MKKIGGIYKITNILNGKFYIGSCINFYTRYHNHISKLRKNIHCNSHLQSSWNKYGESNFKFEIISTCPKEYCIKLEQWFIDNLRPEYNILPIAGSSLGYKHSEETIIKIRKGRRAYIYTEEHKINIAKGNRGNKYSDESKKKMSNSSKGKPKSEEARRNMSIAKKGKTSPMKGKITSEETRRKQSESRKLFLQRKFKICTTIEEREQKLIRKTTK